MFTCQYVLVFSFVLTLTVSSEDATCTKQVQQSPINIEMDNTLYSNKLNFETKVPSNSQFKVEIVNNSLKYELRYEANSTFPQIDWIRIDQSTLYWDLNHIELHWNNNDTMGSEHSINGKFGAAELQFYYSNPLIESFEMAKTETNGILVQVIVLNLGKRLDLAELLNLDYTDLASRQVEVDLSYFISLTENFKFFEYEGSIASSPCVLMPWLVMVNQLEITEEQLRKLRDLSPDGNVREQSELTQGNIVYRNFDQHYQVIGTD